MIKVLQKAIAILELLACSENQPLTLNEIAQKTDMPASTCVGIIKDLCNEHYIEKDPVRGYRLGIMSYCLGSGIPCNHRQVESILCALTQLNEKFSSCIEHIVFTVFKDYVRYSIVLEVSENGSRSITYRANAGALQSATGLLLLSYESRYQREAYLEFYNLPNRFNSVNEFHDYLDRIKENEIAFYAIPNQKNAVAVPVMTHGQANYAIGINVKGNSITPQLIEELQKAAKEIQSKLEG